MTARSRPSTSDPLADEVLKAGPGMITPGTTVMVARDAAGDKKDQPLSLELIPPSKAERARREELKQPVGVGAGESGRQDESGDDTPGGDAGEPPDNE